MSDFLEQLFSCSLWLRQLFNPQPRYLVFVILLSSRHSDRQQDCFQHPGAPRNRNTRPHETAKLKTNLYCPFICLFCSVDISERLANKRSMHGSNLVSQIYMIDHHENHHLNPNGTNLGQALADLLHKGRSGHQKCIGPSTRSTVNEWVRDAAKLQSRLRLQQLRNNCIPMPPATLI
jgi:hypothetical protein